VFFGLWIGREKENGKESIHERNTKMDFDVAVKTSRFTVQNFGIDRYIISNGCFRDVQFGGVEVQRLECLVCSNVPVLLVPFMRNDPM
jgi:hypothetical protein